MSDDQPELAQVDVHAQSGAAGQTRRTILLVEDEPLLRMALGDALREAGYRVKEAIDGVEALVVVRECAAIELLITDVNLPRFDGYRLIGAALNIRPALHVIMMTGYANATSPKRDFEGVIPIIRKPFVIEHMVDTVDAILAGDAKGLTVKNCAA
jgi:DNA-binding NtrC family response regulator